MTVNDDGTFTPSAVTVSVGDTVIWEGLDDEDAIVRIEAPFGAADVCGVADDDLDHFYDPSDPDEFTGPMRKGVPGVFVRGPLYLGDRQVLATEDCECEFDPFPCTPLEVTSARDEIRYKYCTAESAFNATMMETWGNPDITGVMITMDWETLQPDYVNGDDDFFWDYLDREMDRAVEAGKPFALAIRAGFKGNPLWLFDYAGPLTTGPVTAVDLKTWTGSVPPTTDCGTEMTLPSPADENYRTLYVHMLEVVAEHVRSDSRWYQALAQIKVGGMNLLTPEAKLPNSCPDRDLNGVLDTIAGDPCSCNTKIWARAGYTPDALYEFYRVVENALYELFPEKTMGFSLIQAGFPRTVDPSNFLGDTLENQVGKPLLAGGTTLDDIKGAEQTEVILADADLGRFVDPYGIGEDADAGALFMPYHNGLGLLPEDLGLPGCDNARTVLAPGIGPARADFPIPAGTWFEWSAGEECPNKWVVNESTLNDQLTGYQTNNQTQVSTPGDVESALWNLTINSNAVNLEIYESLAWEIFHRAGVGPIDPTRTLLGASNPAPYSKSMRQWNTELHERRSMLADPDPESNLGEPFPDVWEHTFVAGPGTYHYINPTSCPETADADRVGVVTVVL